MIGLKDQLRPDQFTYDYENEELYIDFTKHTVYVRARFVFVARKTGVEGEQYYFSPWSDTASCGKDAEAYTPIKPGDIAKIPLGFGIEVPDGYTGFVFPRSSMAVKGLVCELLPVDSGYRGEIHAILSNVSDAEQTIHKDARIGQLIITPVIIADYVLSHGEQRGTGAFGSTGV